MKHIQDLRADTAACDTRGSTKAGFCVLKIKWMEVVNRYPCCASLQMNDPAWNICVYIKRRNAKDQADVDQGACMRLQAPLHGCVSAQRRGKLHLGA